MTAIYTFFEEHHIDYQRVDHPPVYTCEQAAELVPPLPGAKTKNLFLRDNKGKRHFLVVVPSAKTVDLKGLSAEIGAGKLGFASPKRLLHYLGVEPGAVSILGVVNDSAHAVEIFVDRELWNGDSFQCHPLVNTATLSITKPELEKVFAATGHTPRPITVPARAE